MRNAAASASGRAIRDTRTASPFEMTGTSWVRPRRVDATETTRPVPDARDREESGAPEVERPSGGIVVFMCKHQQPGSEQWTQEYGDHCSDRERDPSCLKPVHQQRVCSCSGGQDGSDHNGHRERAEDHFEDDQRIVGKAVFLANRERDRDQVCDCHGDG